MVEGESHYPISLSVQTLALADTTILSNCICILCQNLSSAPFVVVVVYVLVREEVLCISLTVCRCTVLQFIQLNDIIGIFQMAKELDGILDSSEAEPAKSCITGDGSTSFLEKIITPIYETMAAVGLSVNGSISMFDLLLSYR